MPVSKITDYEVYGSITRFLGDGSTENVGHQFNWSQQDDEALIHFDGDTMSAAQLVDLAKTAVELQGFLIAKGKK